MDRILTVLTFLAALGSGLMAGLFFAFSTSVMAALGRIPPAAGISAMQSINVTIINPVFFVVFFGTAVLSVLLAVAALVGWAEGRSASLLAGSLLYLAGCMLVTMVFNVPLNNALAAVSATGADGASVWARYLSTWTMWNHVRTVGCLAAMGAFILALR
jgi:uncharacterized membrane protein